MGRRALFLDFDGVLHGVDDVEITYTAGGIECTGTNLFRYLPLLSGILDRFPEVLLVVSSSWRHHYRLDEIRRFFGAYGHRVIATTLRLGELGEPPSNRFQECAATAEHLGISDWLMIDDQPGIVWGSWIPSREQSRRVIFCDSSMGLRTPLVLYAIERRLLERQE